MALTFSVESVWFPRPFGFHAAYKVSIFVAMSTSGKLHECCEWWHDLLSKCAMLHDCFFAVPDGQSDGTTVGLDLIFGLLRVFPLELTG